MSETSQGDIGAIMDTTVPVEIEWRAHKIVVQVYEIGRERLTLEERQILKALADGRNGASDQLNYNETVEWSRTTLPLMLAGWEFDGFPMTRAGAPFPPTYENACKLPDALVVDIASAATEVWTRGNPTIGASSDNTSEQAVKSSETSSSQTEISGS